MSLNGVMALFCVISANLGIASGQTALKFMFTISFPDEFLSAGVKLLFAGVWEPYPSGGLNVRIPLPRQVVTANVT